MAHIILNNVQKNIKRIETLKNTITVLEIDDSLFHQFGKIKSVLKKSGLGDR